MDKRKRQMPDDENEQQEGTADCSSCNHFGGGIIPMNKSHLQHHKKAKIATGSDHNDIGDDKTSSTSSSCSTKGSHYPMLRTFGVDNWVHKRLARFIISNNIKYDAVEEPSFLNFVRGVAECGLGYKPPTSLMLQRKYIPEVQMEVETYVRNVRQSWQITGCAIMLDVWNNFIHIIAYSPEGRVFLKLHEILECNKLNSIVEDVVSSIIQDIGVNHSVPMITSNSMISDLVKDVILNKFPRTYQILCPSHEIYSLIKAICNEVEWVYETIDHAIFILKFTSENGINLSFSIRQYKTKKDLKQPCMSKFVSDYHMLHWIFYNRIEFQNLVASQEWRLLDYNHDQKAKISGIIQSASFWTQMQEVLDVIMEPLVEVLRLIEDDESTVGYLYEAMKKAREAIERHFVIDQIKYAKILELFDKRRSDSILHPIHAAAAFLNPAYMSRKDFKLDSEMKAGINFVLKTLVMSEEKEKFVQDQQLYFAKVSKVFNEMAYQMLEFANPVTWWRYCGNYLPTLKKYAMRILSQPCKCSCDVKFSAALVSQIKMMNGYDASTKSQEDLLYTTMNARMMESHRLDSIDIENYGGTDFLPTDYKPKDMQDFFPYFTLPLLSFSILHGKAQRRWTKLYCVLKCLCIYLRVKRKTWSNMELYDVKPNVGEGYLRS